MIDRRQFLKWTGYMIAVAVVAPSALIEKELKGQIEWSWVEHDFENPNGFAIGAVKWSEDVYRKVQERSHWSIFTGDLGEYDGIVLRYDKKT